ncbi:MAG: Peptidase inhibitor family [Solirubrobacteraceae bacterium]
MHHMYRRSAVRAPILSALIALAIFGTLIVASPASATTYPADCPEGSVCLYKDAGWKGKIFELHQSDLSNKDWSIPRDQVSSWANRTWGVYSLQNDTLFGYFAIQWMRPRSSSTWVGRADNDRADRLHGTKLW